MMPERVQADTSKSPKSSTLTRATQALIAISEGTAGGVSKRGVAQAGREPLWQLKRIKAITTF